MVDNTLTGVISSGDTYHPEMNAANPAATKKRDIKNRWKLLGSATALLVALGAFADQATNLTEKLKEIFNILQPATSEWTEDESVIIKPDKNIDPFTIQMCDSTQESGVRLHIALLLEKSNNEEIPPTFVLKKQGKGCRVETGRVLMNPGDFDKYIQQTRYADFKLSYSRAHLHSLDLLVNDALEQCSTESSVNKVTGGNKS